MLMKTFFSQIFQAFVQSRQLQADRIVQRHGFVPVERGRDFRRPIEMTNVAAFEKTEAPAEFKLAA
jgi:hypothetical protein